MHRFREGQSYFSSYLNSYFWYLVQYRRPSVVPTACTWEESGAVYFSEVANNDKFATERIESKFTFGCKLQYCTNAAALMALGRSLMKVKLHGLYDLGIWVVLLYFSAIGMFSFSLNCCCCQFNLALQLLDWCIMLLVLLDSSFSWVTNNAAVLEFISCCGWVILGGQVFLLSRSQGWG